MIKQPRFIATSRSSSLKEAIGTSHSFQYNSPKVLKTRGYNLRSTRERQRKRNSHRLADLLDGYESDSTAVVKTIEKVVALPLSGKNVEAVPKTALPFPINSK